MGRRLLLVLLLLALPWLGASVARAEPPQALPAEKDLVPTLRKWLEVEATAGQSLTSRDVLRDGFPENQALSRAMAFILDQADP